MNREMQNIIANDYNVVITQMQAWLVQITRGKDKL
jgi:hypothetical protein